MPQTAAPSFFSNSLQPFLPSFIYNLQVVPRHLMHVEEQLSPNAIIELPPLPLAQWQATYDTLHMWAQMAGKVRLKQCPAINHWWGTALYVTANGLTTSPVPYGQGSFEIQFDFVQHKLVIETSSGDIREFKLEPQSVAEVYRKFRAALHDLGIDFPSYKTPAEFPDRFDQTRSTPPMMRRRRPFWRILQ